MMRAPLRLIGIKRLFANLMEPTSQYLCDIHFVCFSVRFLSGSFCNVSLEGFVFLAQSELIRVG